MGVRELDIGALLFKLNGRISRQTFWICFALLITAQIIIFLLLQFSGLAVVTSQGAPTSGFWINHAIVSVIFLWPTICILTKRLHDCGKSGWWQLIILIPIVGLFWFAIQFGLKKGIVGRNRFGADPLPKMSPFD